MARPPTTGITQRILIPVKGGVETWQEPLKQMLLALKDQPGVIRHRWGPWTEDSSKLEILVGWTSQEARDAFVKSEAHEAVAKAMRPVMSGRYLAFSIGLEPYAPRDAIDSAVVEMITVEGCEDQGDQRLRARFMQVTTMDGCNGAACGFSDQEVDLDEFGQALEPPNGHGHGHGPPGAENGGGGGGEGRTMKKKKGRVWVGACGWTSLQKSMEADKSDYLPDCGTRTEIHHVDFKFPIKGFSVTNSNH